jgi:hypothetical protein
LHDTVRLENWGIPAVPVATHEFTLPARAQAAALGRPDFDAVYVQHPIQDQTAAEIEAKAAGALKDIISHLFQGAVHS